MQVLNGLGQPMAGVDVDFAAPASGASAVLPMSRATTDANGHAAVQAIANGIPGSYTVSASVDGLPAVGFALSNLTADVDVGVDVRSLRSYAQAGDVLDYLVTVHNYGQDVASGVGVIGQLSAQFDTAFASWICLGPGSSQCSAGGDGNLQDDNLRVAGNGSVSYVVTAPLHEDADGRATLLGRSSVAGDTNPANDEQSAEVPVVLYRDGFERHGALAGLQPESSTLSIGEAMAIVLPAPGEALVDTVLSASATGASAESFRIERLVRGDATWLRLVVRDGEQHAFASAWARVDPARELQIRLVESSDASASDTPQRRVQLHSSSGIVTMPLGSGASRYALRVSAPVPGLPQD